ncbi:amino acid permease-domain-containing protein [Aspergillus pseudoustus]|uniref:Amino acid permease-domain-containing protein n=1 Tax=Aspergillus pseudoustus TaxID=1810923 RepID=A0ABR4KF28_9EURO
MSNADRVDIAPQKRSLEKLEDLELPSPSSFTPEDGDAIPGPTADAIHPPKLDRTISWIGAVGLAFTISNSWMSYAATFGPALVYGGGVTVLFAPIVAITAQWIVLLGVCEMASAIPSSGGCYHFTYFLAPKKTRKFASFTVGIINLLGFWIGGVSGMIYTTISVYGIVAFWVEDFAPTQWQVYLGFVGIILLSLIPIFTLSQRHTKYLTTACLILSLFCLVFFIITLLAMGRGHYAPSNLVAHRNLSGWSNPTGWLLSITLGEYSFSATGTVVHLAEEVPRPRRDIPRAINVTMAIGVATAIAFTIVLLGGIRDLDAVQNAWIPILEIFYQATGSKAVASLLQACLAGLYFTTVSTQWVSVSRISWTLARDNALPFSRLFSQISPTRKFPVRATLLSASFCITFGLIYIASSTAFNSVVNMATLLQNVAYTVPQGIMAFQARRGKLSTEREFSLDLGGRRRTRRRRRGLLLGYVVNSFAWIRGDSRSFPRHPRYVHRPPRQIPGPEDAPLRLYDHVHCRYH